MAVGTFSAARTVCDRGSWHVTNLALQKILYIAHMLYLGRAGEPLVSANFEAWDYGPVLPNLYHKVKFFGDKPIKDIFYAAAPIEGTSEYETLIDACDFLLPKRPGELVAITHWENGAWAKHYSPGVRGRVIPNSDIIDEYRRRTAA